MAAVDKPAGLLVHPTYEAKDRVTCMNLLRNELGCWVYPAHRLDRGTSGVVLFGLSGQVAAALQACFRERTVEKVYQAIVRGYIAESGEVERALDGQPAQTSWRVLERFELPDAVGPFASVRYSFVELRPRTGHRHQLRRHMRGLNHPILGDTKHGDSDHNRYARSAHGFGRMALAARRLALPHPFSPGPLVLEAPLAGEIEELLVRLRGC